MTKLMDIPIMISVPFGVAPKFAPLGTKNAPVTNPACAPEIAPVAAPAPGNAP